jgi:hypothetical protein
MFLPQIGLFWFLPILHRAGIMALSTILPFLAKQPAEAKEEALENSKHAGPGWSGDHKALS